MTTAEFIIPTFILKNGSSGETAYRMTACYVASYVAMTACYVASYVATAMQVCGHMEGSEVPTQFLYLKIW